MQVLDASEPDLARRILNTRLVAFDFDGVFTDNKVYVFQDGSEAVCCFRGDGIGLQRLRNLGVQTVIISTEVNPVVSARSRKLGVPCLQGCQDKLKALNALITESGLSLRQVAFVGNDVNDLECLDSVGLSIIVQDAHREVVGRADYQTQARGGQGAVREVCDLFWSIWSNAAKGVNP